MSGPAVSVDGRRRDYLCPFTPELSWRHPQALSPMEVPVLMAVLGTVQFGQRLSSGL